MTTDSIDDQPPPIPPAVPIDRRPPSPVVVRRPMQATSPIVDAGFWHRAFRTTRRRARWFGALFGLGVGLLIGVIGLLCTTPTQELHVPVMIFNGLLLLITCLYYWRPKKKKVRRNPTVTLGLIATLATQPEFAVLAGYVLLLPVALLVLCGARISLLWVPPICSAAIGASIGRKGFERSHA